MNSRQDEGAVPEEMALLLSTGYRLEKREVKLFLTRLSFPPFLFLASRCVIRISSLLISFSLSWHRSASCQRVASGIGRREKETEGRGGKVCKEVEEDCMSKERMTKKMLRG